VVGNLCEADEPLLSVDYPTCAHIVGRLRRETWGKELKQIPATVIDKGILKNVPYASFRCANGDCELNVYGDPSKPAGVEIGVYRNFINDLSAKKRCIEFVAELLPNESCKVLLRSLNQDQGLVTLGNLTLETTPPFAEDAYGGWWVSAYNIKALDASRASDKEMAEISVPKTGAVSSSTGNGSGWTQSEIKLARPSSSLVETNLTSLVVGGSEYKNARVVRRNPAQATIYHSSGIATVLIQNLNSDLKSFFQFDPVASAAYTKMQADYASRLAQQAPVSPVAPNQPLQIARVSPAAYTPPLQQEQTRVAQVPTYTHSHSGGSVYVRSYTRKDGTYVHSHSRRR
jgi:hypothetical protein